MNITRVLCCVVLYYMIQIVKTKNPLVIKTSGGYVKGKLNLNPYEGTYYYSYQGIPYAESPVGDLRFVAPVPKKIWNDTFDASHEGAVCPQTNLRYGREQMSEDCLHVSVYTPANRTRESLPVFVFIHGGAFQLLADRRDFLYGPDFLLSRNFIYVAINYRLGVLGFLCLRTKEVPGNAGMKDLILGLKWIKQNIKNFGGDENNITIGGHSSGATVAHLLMFTDQTTGLFHRVILISGSAINHRSLLKYPRDRAFALARLLGMETDDVNILGKKLRKTEAIKLVAANQKMVASQQYILYPPSPFVPCIEVESAHAVITRHPLSILEKGITQNVPVLAGFNSNEGLYMSGYIKDPEIIKTALKMRDLNELLVPPDIEYPKGSNQSIKLENSISKFYFKEDLSNMNLKNIVDLISDSHYVFSTDSWINLHKSQHISKPLYYYVFDFDGYLNWAKLYYNIKLPGTSHADEMGYMFVTAVTKERLYTCDQRNKRMMNIIITFMSNFIKYGNPTPNNADFNITWPQYDLKDKKYIVLSDHLRIETFNNSTYNKRLYFWYEVYDQYQRYVRFNNGGATNKSSLGITIITIYLITKCLQESALRLI